VSVNVQMDTLVYIVKLLHNVPQDQMDRPVLMAELHKDHWVSVAVYVNKITLEHTVRMSSKQHVPLVETDRFVKTVEHL